MRETARQSKGEGGEGIVEVRGGEGGGVMHGQRARSCNGTRSHIPQCCGASPTGSHAPLRLYEPAFDYFPHCGGAGCWLPNRRRRGHDAQVTGAAKLGAPADGSACNEKASGRECTSMHR